MRNKTFSVAEALEILEMDRDRLFYLISRRGLVQPAFRGIGRGGRTRLSLFNILNLALIRELLSWEISTQAIKQIFSGRVAIEYRASAYPLNMKKRGGHPQFYAPGPLDEAIWRHIASYRKKYDERGCMLFIQRWAPREPKEQMLILTHKTVSEILFDTFRVPLGHGYRPHLGHSSTLLVNLMDIVLTIEELTGDKLREVKKH
jgi:hypothetical protein